jgi:exonuclease VII small subunit
MSDQDLTPAQKLAQDFKALQQKVNSLQEGVRLAHLRDEMEDIDNQTNALPGKISGLRARGYVYEKDLEGRAVDYKQRWGSQRMLVLQQITVQSQALDMDLRALESLISQLASRLANVDAARPMYQQAESTASSLESKVNAAEGTIRGMYNSFKNDYSSLNIHLDRVDWMLTSLSQATFQLIPTESAVMAVEALWNRDGKEDKDDPRGVLYLTDQRLLFEQKQEIATKKVLFITTAKEKVQKLMFTVDIAQLETVKATKQGFFKNEDNIELTFASGAPFYKMGFHLFGQDCNEWQALLGRVKSRDFDKDRAVALDQAEVDKVRKAPTQCPVCGGAITATVLRGMDSIKCEYCGNVIRL